MAKVLVIKSTVSAADKSFSIALVDKFIEEYQLLNPNDEIITLDLNNEEMAKTTISRDNFSEFFSEEHAHKYIKQLKEVDKVVVSSAMNNFSITTMLKNYLDHVLLAEHTFTYKYAEKGASKGLLDHLTVQILLSQGAPKGWYPWGDMAAYLKGTWEFAGAKVNDAVLLSGTKTTPLNTLSPADGALTIIDEIKEAAKKF